MKELETHDRERWEPIPRFKRLYQVSSFGRIKRLMSFVKHSQGGVKIVREKILKNWCKSKYVQYTFCNNGNRTNLLIHRIVAKVFIPNPENKPCVNHKDGNTSNNRVDNLEWVTYSENEIHSHRVLGKSSAMYNLKNYDSGWLNPIVLKQYNIRGKNRKIMYHLLIKGVTTKEIENCELSLMAFYGMVSELCAAGVNIQKTILINKRGSNTSCKLYQLVT